MATKGRKPVQDKGKRKVADNIGGEISRKMKEDPLVMNFFLEIEAGEEIEDAESRMQEKRREIEENG